MIEVVAAAIRDDGRYLACRRLPERGGKWEFPGGKIENGESPQQALRREIREELGIEIEIESLLATVQAEGSELRLLTFAATLAGAMPTTSSDHDKLEWLRPSELLGLNWSEADLAAVTAIAVQ